MSCLFATRNQLTAVNNDKGNFYYDYRPDGLRHSKTIDDKITTHTYIGGSVVMDRTDGVVDATYLYGISLIAQDAGGSRKFYNFNGHGDTVQLIDSNGQVLWTYDHDAFGNEKPIAGQDPAIDNNPFRYSGEYFDKETGYIYLRARYYAPDSGRFISQDSWSFMDSSMNLYAFCGSNPVMFSDPSGHKVVKDFGNGIQLLDDGNYVGRAGMSTAEFNAALQAMYASGGLNNSGTDYLVRNGLVGTGGGGSGGNGTGHISMSAKVSETETRTVYYIFYTTGKNSDFSKQAKYQQTVLINRGISAANIIMREINTRAAFEKEWNGMGEIDKEIVNIADVFIYSHGNERSILLQDGTATEALSINGMNEMNTREIGNLNSLHVKNIHALYLYTCNGGHLDQYFYGSGKGGSGNVASVLSSRVPDAVVYAFDGNITFGPLVIKTHYEPRLSLTDQNRFYEVVEKYGKEIAWRKPTGKVIYLNGEYKTSYYPDTAIVSK